MAHKITYSVERVVDINQVSVPLLKFLMKSADYLAKLYPEFKFDWRNFDFARAMSHDLFLVARKNKRPIGVLFASLYPNILDPQVRVLKQNLLFVEPGHGRAIFLLMRELIDFGRGNADHVVTMIGRNTNIKPRSLEKFGFSKMETTYRLGV